MASGAPVTPRPWSYFVEQKRQQHAAPVPPDHHEASSVSPRPWSYYEEQKTQQQAPVPRSSAAHEPPPGLRPSATPLPWSHTQRPSFKPARIGSPVAPAQRPSFPLARVVDSPIPPPQGPHTQRPPSPHSCLEQLGGAGHPLGTTRAAHSSGGGGALASSPSGGTSSATSSSLAATDPSSRHPHLAGLSKRVCLLARGPVDTVSAR